MICPCCETRWAPFPEKDFTFTGRGIIPRTPGAGERRLKQYNLNEKLYCGCNEEYQKHLC